MQEFLALDAVRDAVLDLVRFQWWHGLLEEGPCVVGGLEQPGDVDDLRHPYCDGVVFDLREVEHPVEWISRYSSHQPRLRSPVMEERASTNARRCSVVASQRTYTVAR